MMMEKTGGSERREFRVEGCLGLRQKFALERC